MTDARDPLAEALPSLLVAGLGRCGLTAMMNALHAGGMPCAGPAPAFEPPEAMPPIAAQWLAAQSGRAVKTLLPQESPALRTAHAVAILLSRDPEQQGASQCKLLTQMMGMTLSRAQRRAMSTTIPRDQIRAEAALPEIVAHVRFEDLLAEPARVMERACLALAPWWTLDADRAASVIRQRLPGCAPGFEMELAMLAAAQEPQR